MPSSAKSASQSKSQEVEQQHMHMMGKLLQINTTPRSMPSSSRSASQSQSQEPKETKIASKPRHQRPQTPVRDTTSASRSRYLSHRGCKPVVGLPTVSRQIKYDTTDEELDNMWVGVCSSKAAEENGQIRPVIHSQQDQIHQSRKLQSFFGVAAEFCREEPPQNEPAQEGLIDWESFYSTTSETLPRDTFLATPSVDWSTLSDDCPVTSTVAKPMPRESYLSGPSADWATYSKDCPITSNVSVTQAPIELMGSFPTFPGSPEQANSRLPVIDEIFELEGDIPLRQLPVLLWSQPQLSNPKKGRSYLNKLRTQYLVEYEGRKDSSNTPSLILDCPKEIVLTQATPTPTRATVGPSAEIVSEGMLTIPPKHYKKKQRQQQVMKESLKMESVKIKQSNTASTTTKSTVVMRGDLTYQGPRQRSDTYLDQF